MLRMLSMATPFDWKTEIKISRHPRRGGVGAPAIACDNILEVLAVR
jgi:hypothetical protein